MKKPESLKSEREELISLLRIMGECKMRIREMIENESSVVECYEKEMDNIYDDLLKAMSDLGDMIGYTIFRDINEGKEVKL